MEKDETWRITRKFITPVAQRMSFMVATKNRELRMTGLHVVVVFGIDQFTWYQVKQK
jgi:hypothetical protein